MKEKISLKARLVRDMIKFSTSQHIIGPKIQNGTLRRKWVEPVWHQPDGFVCMPIRMKKFDMELLTPPQEDCGEVILQLHGGGYIGKMKNSYRDFAVLYSQMPGYRKVLTIDYRVAPEHPYPAALQDALTAYQWLLGVGYQGENIILAGDSAGGGLALALCMYLRDHEMPIPKCMVLMSPWTDLTASGVSYTDNYEKDPLFGNTKESMIYNGEYVADSDPEDPYISPMFGDFTGLPPMLFQAGSIEMLLSDTITSAQKAREAGCQVQETIYEGMFHVFQAGMMRMPESERAWKEVEAFLTFHSPWITEEIEEDESSENQENE